ncbi:MAG: hypothetical protein COA47_10325 [Robiginitomaculum sp.]|nr:MAG: hypothetical protein COA47_10325 [Robiginitomaculum sp.]
MNYDLIFIMGGLFGLVVAVGLDRWRFNRMVAKLPPPVYHLQTMYVLWRGKQVKLYALCDSGRIECGVKWGRL